MNQRNTTWMLTLVLAVAVAGCGAGEGSSICDEAAQHIAQCTGQPAPNWPVTCDEPELGLADALLHLDCAGVNNYLTAQGKADRPGFSEGFYSEEPICNPSDPMDNCEAYCHSIRVEFSFFGITLPGCVYHSSCDFVDQDLGRCQCKYRVCPGEPSDEEMTSEYPFLDDGDAWE